MSDHLLKRRREVLGVLDRHWRDLRDVAGRLGEELSGSGLQTMLDELVKLDFAERKQRGGAPMGVVYRKVNRA